MATFSFNAIIRTIKSFRKDPKYSKKNILGEESERKRRVAEGNKKAVTRLVSPSVKTVRLAVDESPAEINKKREAEKRAAKINSAKQLIKSVDDKFNDIDKLISDSVFSFYILFDPDKYPLVSDAVSFFSDGQKNNFIDWNIYNKAKDNYFVELRRTGEQYSKAMRDDGSTVMSITQQSAKIKKTNVILLAFKVLLEHLEKWFWGLPIVKQICKIKVLGKRLFRCENKRSTYTGRDGQLYIPKSHVSSSSLQDAELLVSNAKYILEYVRGAASDEEQYIEAEWGKNKQVFLISYLLEPTKMVFTNSAHIASGVTNDDRITAIGSQSLFYSSELQKATAKISADSKDLDLLLHGEYLEELDRILGRIIKILHGWYLDPRTYCCLINAFGGINRAVPEWLKTIKYVLGAGMIFCELEMDLNEKKLTNILNLLITSAIGSIINSLGNFLKGWAKKSEIKFMKSFLANKSKFMRCLPFDQLITEFGFFFDEMINDLEHLLRQYTEYLTVSNLNFGIYVNDIERKQRLQILYEFTDRFISAWDWGYICSENTSKSDIRSTADKKKYDPPKTETDVTAYDKSLDGSFTIEKAVTQPFVSKSEANYFLKHVLNVDQAVIDEVMTIYEDPDQIAKCMEGWNFQDIEILKKQVEKLVI